MVFISWFLTTILSFVCIILSIVYVYSLYSYGYWERRNIEYLKPSFPCGNFVDNVLQRKCFGVLLKDMYNQIKGNYGGFFTFYQPALIVKDLDILKHILIKDFKNFPDRGLFVDTEKEPLTGHLFAIHGKQWVPLRKKLSPAFTSGKLKTMFGTVLATGAKLGDYLSKETESGKNIFEMKEMCTRYAAEIIASVGFGVETDSITNSVSDFRVIGNKTLEPTMRNNILFGLMFFAPNILKMLRIRFFLKVVEDFYISMVTQTLKHREDNNIAREDFIQLLIQIRNSGEVNQDGDWNTKIVEDKKMSVFEIAAHCLVFHVAGFETSATALSFLIYELAKNKKVQEKALESMKNVLKNHDDKLTYESVQEMKYLDQCIDETLRKYPSLPMISRRCEKTYKVPDSDLVIEKGISVFVSLLGIHHDPKYYPNPEIFDPERFTVENKSTRPAMAFLPFGEGPRNCIGLRLGLLNVKIGIITFLMNYKLELGPGVPDEVKFSGKSLLLLYDDELNIKLTKR